jgi:hypothetical protein
MYVCMRFITLFSTFSSLLFQGDCARAKELLKDMVKKLFDSFCNKKSKKIQVKLIDEILLSRFPNECIPVLLPDILIGCHSAKCLYSRAGERFPAPRHPSTSHRHYDLNIRYPTTTLTLYNKLPYTILYYTILYYTRAVQNIGQHHQEEEQAWGASERVH